MVDDAQLRSAAFQRVRELDARFGGAIPAAIIEAGFLLHGESIIFLAAPGASSTPSRCTEVS